MRDVNEAVYTPTPGVDGSSQGANVFKMIMTQKSGQWTPQTTSGGIIGFGYFENEPNYDLGTVNPYSGALEMEVALINMQGEYILRMPAIEVSLDGIEL